MEGVEGGRGGTRSGAFRLGPWQVEPSLHLLSGPGGESRVEPKVLAVLVELARQQGGVVSREELLQAVWGTEHVSEDVLRRAVYELRKLLDDDHRQPRYIETIPGAGYRLVAAVEEAGDPGAPPPGARRRPLTPVAAAALLVAAGVVAFLVLRPTAPVAPTIIPLTTYPGLEYAPALSPDGLRVAFARSASDGTGADLYVKILDAEPPLRLTDLPGSETRPAWSPDGTRLAFVRRRGPRGDGIHLVSALGGGERDLAYPEGTLASGIAWSPDGRWLAYSLRPAPGVPYRVHRMALETLTSEALSHPPPGIAGDGGAVFSPDGRTVAFERSVVPGVDDIYLVPSGGGPERRLTRESRKIYDLAWSASGRELLFTTLDSGTHRLWRIPVTGGAPRRLSGAGEGAMGVTVAASGGRLAYSRYDFRFSMWRMELSGGTPQSLPALSSTHYDDGLAVAPGGDRLAFASTRSGAFEIWTAGLDGSDPVRLTDFGGAATAHPAWSPDGAWLAFHSTVRGGCDLFRVPRDGGRPERLTDEAGDDLVPSWSGDGRSLYFASNRSGRWQVWRLTLESGAAEALTRDGGFLAREGPDGRWLYYSRWGEAGLWRVPTAGGTEQRVVAELGRSQWGNWVVTRQGIYLVGKGPDAEAQLWLADPETGEVRTAAVFTGWPANPSLTLSPDGRWLLYTQLDGLESDLVAVDGAL